MSSNMMARCVDVQCSGIAKAVLMVLADNTADEGICFLLDPDYVARLVCWPEDEVVKAYEELKARGILTKVPDDYGVGQYRLWPEDDSGGRR